MVAINLMRNDEAPPTEQDRGVLRKVLTGYIDGFNRDDKRAWRRFLKRLFGMEPGEMARIEAIIPRNAKFHRKFFALLQLGFDAWDGCRVRRTYKGRPVTKNFERFRKDVVILAGFYEQTFDLRGRMVLEAKSISFANMDDAEFEKVYSAVADVLLEKVLTHYTSRAELDAVVNQMLGFL